MDLKNKTILIIGYGMSGKSVYSFLKQLGSKVLVSDNNEENVKNLDSSEIFTGNYAGIDCVYKSPGIPLHNYIYHEAAQAGLKTINEIDLFMEFKSPKTKVVAITGTNGKSTVTAMVEHVFNKLGYKAAALGNFGVPMLDNLEGLDFAIIECSSYQLEVVQNARFDSSAILNITPDHIDHHTSMEEYIKAKMKVFNSNNIVLNADDEKLSEFIIRLYDEDKNLETFGSTSGATVCISGRVFIIDGDSYSLESEEFDEIRANHNLQNAAAAFLLMAPFGITIEQFLGAIKSYKNLEHRVENVAKFKNIYFINDSKATNAESTMPAIKAFKNIYWLAGGQPKEGGIIECLKCFENVKKSFFYGQAKDEFGESMETILHLEKNKNFYIFETLDEALDSAIKEALQDKNEAVILLSPACASWDQFKNFEHRGSVFKDLVNTFIEKQK